VDDVIAAAGATLLLPLLVSGLVFVPRRGPRLAAVAAGVAALAVTAACAAHLAAVDPYFGDGHRYWETAVDARSTLLAMGGVTLALAVVLLAGRRLGARRPLAGLAVAASWLGDGALVALTVLSGLH
jgi:hypothetical protein